jgi:hypothetical protein
MEFSGVTVNGAACPIVEVKRGNAHPALQENWTLPCIRGARQWLKNAWQRPHDRFLHGKGTSPCAFCRMHGKGPLPCVKHGAWQRNYKTRKPNYFLCRGFCMANGVVLSWRFNTNNEGNERAQAIKLTRMPMEDQKLFLNSEILKSRSPLD